MDFSELAKYGITGIAIILAWLVFYIFKEFKTIVGNHIVHATEAQKDTARAIEGLTEATRDLKEEIRSRK